MNSDQLLLGVFAVGFVASVAVGHESDAMLWLLVMLLQARFMGLGAFDDA